MKFDRRQFFRMSAAGAFVATGCGGGGGTTVPNTSDAAPSGLTGSGSGAKNLEVSVDGLYIIQGHGSNMKIHLVDGTKVGVTTHDAELYVLEKDIDTAQTSPADRIVTVGTDKRWFYSLSGHTVTMPKADSGSDSLTEDPPSSEDGLDVPSSEPGWHSLRRIPDLNKLCGATKITKADAIASTILLKHGHFGVLKPSGLGETAVWKFADGTTTLDKGALSNRVHYLRSNNGNPLVIMIDTKKITLKQGADVQVFVSNEVNHPKCAPGTCPPPNMDHFSGFLKMIDYTIAPTITLVTYTPPLKGLAEPDYCPGSRLN